jgi:ATP-binding cassette subfamily B protein
MKKFSTLKSSFKHVLNNLSEMLKLSWQADKYLILALFIISGFGAVFPLALSFTWKLLIDQVISSQNISPTIPLILVAILGARYFVSAVSDFVMGSLRNTYFDILFRNKFQNKLNYEFYNKVSHLDIQYLEDAKTQDLIAKAQDTFTWRPPDYVRRFTYVFTNIVEFIAAFFILIPYGAVVPLIVTVVAFPQLLLETKIAKIQWSMYGSGTPKVRKLWYFRHLLSNRRVLREMKIFQAQDAMLLKFKKIQKYLYELNKKPLDDYLKFSPLTLIFEGAIVFTLGYLKLPSVLEGKMSVGDFTFYLGLLDRLISGATNMVTNFGLLYENNLYIDHYLDVLNLPKIIKEIKTPKNVPTTSYPPKVEFNHVSFIYPKSKKKVLDDVSFTINPAENIAIVGPNGAGKTTIVKLLCRFYDIQKGEILINGVNIKELSLKDWYKYLGTLFQEFVHYDFTVRENIMLGSAEVVNEKMMKDAAVKSGAAEFIEKLPKKYDQVLGREFEGGAELSQGQWQKIAIARAFYESAPILILDEPTSSIDAEAEYDIFRNLHVTYKEKSLFLISHRFSTVRNADKIYVLQEGKIVEQGNHDDLLRRNGIYARMFNKQAKGYK